MRQAYDFYRTLIIGAIYSFDGVSSVATIKPTLVGALAHCVEVHPILSAAIAGEDTEAPYFVRPPTLDLNNHIEILERKQTLNQDAISTEHSLIKSALRSTHDLPFTSRETIPSWKVVIVPLPDRTQDTASRFLILFAYNHSHGDGKSGLAFHKTFLEGLQLAKDHQSLQGVSSEVKTPAKPLLPTLEQAGKLTISWSYLLSPILGAYLPNFISKPLNLRASATPESPGQWRGLRTTHDKNSFSTGLEMLVVENDKMQKVLSRCRLHGAKFTGLLHQLIVRALSENVPIDAPASSFVSQTAVDLRKNVQGIEDDDMALCPTGYYELFPRNNDPSLWTDWTSNSESPIWHSARSTTEKLAICADTLHDQPIGLLAYLSNFHSWTKGQIGKLRDESYELSNILSFSPAISTSEQKCRIESMVFSQPANANAACLSINVVSKKGGAMTLVLSWQLGVLGLDDEADFAAKVCASIGASFDELAKA